MNALLRKAEVQGLAMIFGIGLLVVVTALTLGQIYEWRESHRYSESLEQAESILPDGYSVHVAFRGGQHWIDVIHPDGVTECFPNIDDEPKQVVLVAEHVARRFCEDQR